MYKYLIPPFFKTISPILPSLSGRLAFEIFCMPTRTSRTKPEAVFWETGEVVDLSSGRSAKSWGHGPTVWLLHGWASRGSTYYKFIPRFVEAGFQVVAWDAPAHGDSPDKTVHLVKYAKALAEDMKDFHKEKEESPFATVGHSFGGCSLAILSKYIDLPKRLVIVGSPSEVPIIFDNYRRLIRLSPKAFAKMVSIAESKINAPLASTSLIANDLSKDAEVLVIHDKDDKEVPFKRFEHIKSCWEGGEFYATEGLGHRRIIKSRKIADKIVDFFKLAHNPVD